MRSEAQQSEQDTLKMSRSAVFIVGIFFFMSICDIFRAEELPLDEVSAEIRDHVETEQLDSAIKSEMEKKESAIKTGNEDGHLKIFYCVSCGYKQAFNQFSYFAKDHSSEITVEGGNFDPVPWKLSLAWMIWIAKGFLLIAIMAGPQPFEAFGFGYPRSLQYAHSNKLSSGIMLFLVSNMIESSLLSTGAFEIFLNGNQIWSKLEKGRLPSQEEFVKLLDVWKSR